ncbi:hypothetical protein ES702_04864 [subsurface metagenome]
MQVEKDSYGCARCGSWFVHDKEGYWLSDQPNLLMEPSSPRDYKRSIWQEASMFHISKERFLEIFEDLPVGFPVSPVMFLHEVLRWHQAELTKTSDLEPILNRIIENFPREGILNFRYVQTAIMALAKAYPSAFEHPIEAPDEFIWQEGKQGPIVGLNRFFAAEHKVYIPDDLRIQHAYIVGKTRQGKSVLMASMILQDIQNGNGVAVIDPHGALIKEWILPRIPKERMDDVILFDPADEEYPIGFNMFQAETRLERRLVKNDIVVAFRRLFQDASWGDNIATIIRTTVDTLLADDSRIYSLLDVANMINDEGFRYEVLDEDKRPAWFFKRFLG